MVNKLVTTAIKWGAKKAGAKIVEKKIETIDYLSDRVLWGAKPLNVGEQESLDCYRHMPNDKTGFCEAVGNKARYDYSHPWKSKK